MGLNTNTNNSKTFVSIIGGFLTVRVDENTPGAIARQLTKGKNAGKTIHELKFKSLSGYIKQVDFVTKEFGKYIEIKIVDGEEYILQISWEDFSVRDGFIKRMPNIDPTKMVEFIAWKNKEGNTAFLIKQDGDNVRSAFTKENPNGMPQATKNKMGVWNFTEVEEFLFDVLEKNKQKFDGSAIINDAKSMFTTDEAPF